MTLVDFSPAERREVLRVHGSGHIVHVSQPTSAGVAKVVAAQARLQQARGWKVTVVSPLGWLSDELALQGVPHVVWEATRESGRMVTDETRRLEQILRRLTPSLVHLHSSKAGLAGRLALRGRLPTLFQPHAWSFEASSSALRAAALTWERWAAHWTDLTLCCSEAERQVGLASGVGGLTLTVGNGIDLAQFPATSPLSRGAARIRLGLDSAVPTVVCVGRLQPQKGQELLLRCWAGVRRQVPGARLLLIGGGPDEAPLRAAAGDGVSIMGAVDRPGDYYVAADVCVLASRWEGLSLALLEGMASTRSTVATDVSGSRELLLDGDAAGAVVPIDDPAEMTAAIVYRLSRPRLCAIEGAAARKRIERSYTTESVALRYTAGYDLVRRLRERKQGRPEPLF